MNIIIAAIKISRISAELISTLINSIEWITLLIGAYCRCGCWLINLNGIEYVVGSVNWAYTNLHINDAVWITLAFILYIYGFT